MCRRLVYLISLVLVLDLVGGNPANGADIDIRYLDEPGPVLDGVVDDIWSLSTEQLIDIHIEGSAPSSSADCSGSWWALRDSEYLYMLVDVNDEALRVDASVADSWQDDSIEIYIDGDNSKGGSIDENDFQYRIRWNTTNDTATENFHSPDSLAGLEYAMATTSDGYLLEIKLPWSSMIGGPPPGGQLIGIDVFINDDDDGGDRDSQVSWHATEGSGWTTPSMWGTALLLAGKKASGPTPADDSFLIEFPGGILGTSLTWFSGGTAASHDVYLGTNYADVEAGTSETFRGNQGEVYYFAGYGYAPDDPYPTGFVPGTTYYWRIDEVEADGITKYTGDVWSFKLPPTKGYAPSPIDGNKFIDPNVDLNWEPGLGAIMHTIYIGDDYDTVNSAITGGTLVGGATTYDLGPLELDTIYFWRVDTAGAYGQFKGDIWNFTTAIDGLGTVVFERWDNLNGDNLDALKSYWMYPNNPDITEMLTRFSSSPNLDNYGGRIHGWLYAPATGDYTFWLSSDNQGELWLSTDSDSSNIKLIAQESDYTGANMWLTGEEQSDPIELQAGEKYYIMALWKEGTGGDHCQVAWQGPGVPTRTIIPGTNLSPYRPLKAYGAKPFNRATGVKQVLNLEWKPGIQAASHQVYFGTDEDAVRNATTASPEYIGTRALGDESYDPGKLAWESTYYWRVDEVNNINSDGPWPGSLWSFTTADFAIVDNFEDYDVEDQIWWNWLDGLGYVKPDAPPKPGNGTGSEIGDPATASFTEEDIVHGGGQSMPYLYNNNDPFKLKYSEAKLTLSDTRDWTEQGVKALSLWFQGRPASVGSFTDNFDGTYTMTGSGTDIEGSSDEFHFAYKTLTGAGTIIARVDSVSDTHDWAKAGVMIRETLDPNSAQAFACITPNSGVASQARSSIAGVAYYNANQGAGEIAAPHWVRLERSLAGDFTVTHSTDGSSWVPVEGAAVQNIPMNSNVYVGLALTSHDEALTCEAAFSNVTITGNVSGQWASQDIGIMSNDAEPMYVVIANNTGQPAVVYHDDPNASQIDTWTEWNIDLRDFTGINLADVNSIAIGLGNRNNPQTGGSGKMYFDDIRLYRPRCVPEKVTLSEADLNSDCVVDFRDFEIMTGDWLANDSALEADLNSDSSVDFKDYAVLADQWLDEQSWPEL